MQIVGFNVEISNNAKQKILVWAVQQHQGSPEKPLICVVYSVCPGFMPFLGQGTLQILEFHRRNREFLWNAVCNPLWKAWEEQTT